MSLIQINDYDSSGGWTDGNASAARAREYCEQLESGQILYFSKPPFDLPAADREFLLDQRQSDFKGHKNVSYRPKTDELRGAATDTIEDNKHLQEIMRRFSAAVVSFIDSFLSPYARHRQLDFASYRPIEEQNRDLSLHKRNDLAHVDAFPSRPTNGGRILRVFTNINPTENRVWETTDGFEAIATKYATDAGLEKLTASTAVTRALQGLAPLLKAVGVKGADRSPYDRFMLRFHDYLKENNEYQKNYPKLRSEFPPNSAWLVYTDTVPHAVLSGRYALEQTFIIPVQAMVAPATSPIKVLEKITGRTLSV